MWEKFPDIGRAVVYRHRADLKRAPQLLGDVVWADGVLHGHDELVIGQEPFHLVRVLELRRFQVAESFIRLVPDHITNFSTFANNKIQIRQNLAIFSVF